MLIIAGGLYKSVSTWLYYIVQQTISFEVLAKERLTKTRKK